MNLRILKSSVTNPWFNLATEDWIFQALDANSHTLFLWRNSETVVIGRSQNPWVECKIDKMEADDIFLARRQSGGGAVFHDLGNTNFTFLSPKDSYDQDANFTIIINALKKLGIEADLSGRNDMQVGDKKISGSAFKHAADRSFHHGTLLVNANMQKLGDYLNPHPLKLKAKFHHVIVATGVVPRSLIGKLEGADLPQVMSYAELLSGEKSVGDTVAVIGAGGIGFDVSEYLTARHGQPLDELGPELLKDPNYRPKAQSVSEWREEWGVTEDTDYQTDGGLTKPEAIQPIRQVYLMQRTKGRLGSGLNKTTGWVHRAHVKSHGVIQVSGAQYNKITNEGIWITNNQGQTQLLRVDSVVVCAGQESVVELMPNVGDAPDAQYHLIGGAKLAAELDAKRAIRDGAEVAAQI